jgi:hypothetical protein
MIVSLLISVLMLGHKVSAVTAVIRLLSRRSEIVQVLEELQVSKSDMSDAVIARARRLSLARAHRLSLDAEDAEDDVVQVRMQQLPTESVSLNPVVP